MTLFETISERRIREARAAGYFDNLPGRGKPIPDLHRERAPGWWAARVVKAERDKLRFEELTAGLRAAMAPLWRLRSEEDVRVAVDRLNSLIAAYNSTTSYQPIEVFEVDTMVAQWRTVGAVRSGRPG